MNEQFGADVRDLVQRCTVSIEGHGRAQFRQAGRQQIGDAAAIAEPGDAQLAVTARQRSG